MAIASLHEVNPPREAAAAAGPEPFCDVFRLRPVKGAVISDISEATASAPVPPEERVNFHIGNPVQDPRLVEMYARIALGLAPLVKGGSGDLGDALLSELGWEKADKGKIDFLLNLIRNSAPYLPRGGFQKSKPGELVSFFGEWLNNQPEPLSYDFGEKTGKREVILASGGVYEALRVFFHALSTRLERLPAQIFLHGLALPEHILRFSGLCFHRLPEDETDLIEALETGLSAHEGLPAFVVLGKLVSEEVRRSLRLLSRKGTLFIVEANNAPNHLSLAREAGMMNRTLRFLTPAVFSPSLGGLATVFVAGFHEFVSIIETMHFQLKGTPSATEVELLVYLLKHGAAPKSREAPLEEILYADSAPLPEGAQNAARRIVSRFEARVSEMTSSWAARAQEKLRALEERTAARLAPARGWLARNAHAGSLVEGLDFRELVEMLPGRQDDLLNAFKHAFLSHHPYYRADATLVVSGSARTALSLLGFHAGIEEVIVPDLSWTYEHCFPKVTAVPLTADFRLDVEGLISAVEEKIRRQDDWCERGAVVLNNPHNATGRVFAEESLATLLRRLLERGVLVIDDLSYQNVAPRKELEGPRTLRQIANELCRQGYLSDEQADGLITVHSLSKTDCLAGARLAVVEIRKEELRERFGAVNSTITPNLGAILLAWLFYRRSAQHTNSYWRLRNVILEERMAAMEKAAAGLPEERNTFGITITRPEGALYPRMSLARLPSGVSLEWLASGLARQGVGLVPLTTFAHTEEGFEAGRKAFRLTLGGADGADRLLTKTRRVLIDLNRIIAEEGSRYNRLALPATAVPLRRPRLDRYAIQQRWDRIAGQLPGLCRRWAERKLKEHDLSGLASNAPDHAAEFVVDRLDIFGARFRARLEHSEALLALAEENEGEKLAEFLEPEFYKDNLERRQHMFRRRLFDRTVHPTQMYSIQSELLWDQLINSLIAGRAPETNLVDSLAREVACEYLGLNVAIDSRQEGDELLLDLSCAIDAEDFARFQAGNSHETFLSFWGDWDGSNRPSGQGHRLVATVLMENVERMGRLLLRLLKVCPEIRLDHKLIEQVQGLPAAGIRFRALFDQITDLTHQLERRYKGLLPFAVQPGLARRVAMRLHLARDPVFELWEHNDRLERRMLALRRERRRTLEHYFELNKSLRKILRSNLRQLCQRPKDLELTLAAAGFRDLLRRFVITPRIHQSLVTSPDPFAIDTTVFNIMEINELGARYGNPGMVLALQVSMSTDAEALISLDRKMQARRQEVQRAASCQLPGIWLIPLFEDVEVTRRIADYLNRIWDYAVQSRRLNESPEARFSEIICEVFIAGSDLSQQIGQPAGQAAFRQAKFDIVRWLAERGLVRQVRVKLGSGEPMQRQGGYYAPVSGRPAFDLSPENQRRLDGAVEPSAKRSAHYATTPLLGVFAGHDLRTFQSNLSERIRHLKPDELAGLLHHVAETQRFYHGELIRAAEPLTETRLHFVNRGLQELKRLTLGAEDPAVEEFMRLATENFRRILYGAEEDVVGIYVISHFIARTMPPLRDRPTVRPASDGAAGRGQRILERIASTIPFARYGSSLRAIAHNQAQTFVLGVNQLTTGLFRALNSFARSRFAAGEEEEIIASRILPVLPVYEILHSLRLFHDPELRWLSSLEQAFPAGNSALTALREDVDLIRATVPLLQRELLRRHGVPVQEFFEGDRFQPGLLPTLRPDLAVLMQPDLFNTDFEALINQAKGPVSTEWRKEVDKLLRMPVEIRQWRRQAWEILWEPVFSRVSSFVELATALYSVARRTPEGELVLPGAAPQKIRGSIPLLSNAAEDSLQQFLAAALEYLSSLPRSSMEVPAKLIKAMKEVKQTVRIEEPALSSRQQALLRFYLLQIARVAGENG